MQDAYDAAGNGDVVLVRDGSYPGTLDLNRNKTVYLHAEEGAVPVLGPGTSGEPSLWVRGLPAGQELYLRGFDVVAPIVGFGLYPSVAVIENNDGEVWVEDCRFDGPNAFGIQIRDNAGVQLVRCVSYERVTFTTAPGNPVYSRNTNLTLWDCQLTSEDVPPDVVCTPWWGKSALWLSGGTLFAAGCTFTGGGSACGGDGGDAVYLEGGAVARIRDCVFTPGMGSTGTHYVTNVTTVGEDGEEVHVVPGSGSTYEPIDGMRRGFELASPLRAGVDAFHHQYVGEPGDFVYLLWSTSGQIPGFYLAIERGSFVIDFSTLDGLALGVLDATGVLDLTDPPISIGPLTTFSFACQATFLKPGQAFFLAPPSVLTLVDPSF